MKEQSLSATLLPCPHCGKADTLALTTAEALANEGEDDPAPWDHSPSWTVICDASKPRGPGGCGASGGFKPSEEEAIEAWNLRTLPPPSAGELSDERIIERCKAAGVNWLKPDEDPDGFPGSFDMATMEEMRAILASASPAAAGVPEGWRPIATAPEDENVLVATQGGHVDCAFWTDDGDGPKWWWLVSANEYAKHPLHPNLIPTHWMPLPAAPVSASPSSATPPAPDAEITLEWEHPCPFRGEPTLTPIGKACSACGMRAEHINDDAVDAPTANEGEQKGGE